MRRNLEQRLCCATRFAAALFPVLQRAHGNTEHAGEVRLRQAELGARLGGFGHFEVEHAAGLAGLDLTHGLQQFFRSEEHTSELQSLMRISYAVFCLKKKKQHTDTYKIY